MYKDRKIFIKNLRNQNFNFISQKIKSINHRHCKKVHIVKKVELLVMNANKNKSINFMLYKYHI